MCLTKSKLHTLCNHLHEYTSQCAYSKKYITGPDKPLPPTPTPSRSRSRSHNDTHSSTRAYPRPASTRSPTPTRTTPNKSSSTRSNKPSFLRSLIDTLTIGTCYPKNEHHRVYGICHNCRRKCAKWGVGEGEAMAMFERERRRLGYAMKDGKGGIWDGVLRPVRVEEVDENGIGGLRGKVVVVVVVDERGERPWVGVREGVKEDRGEGEAGKSDGSTVLRESPARGSSLGWSQERQSKLERGGGEVARQLEEMNALSAEGAYNRANVDGDIGSAFDARRSGYGALDDGSASTKQNKSPTAEDDDDGDLASAWPRPLFSPKTDTRSSKMAVPAAVKNTRPETGRSDSSSGSDGSRVTLWPDGEEWAIKHERRGAKHERRARESNRAARGSPRNARDESRIERETRGVEMPGSGSGRRAIPLTYGDEVDWREAGLFTERPKWI